MIVGREAVDCVVGELGTREAISIGARRESDKMGVGRGVKRGTNGRETHVKPLISLNSFVILPPWSSTCFFAASSCSGEAPDLRVTYPHVRHTHMLRSKVGHTLTAGMLRDVQRRSVFIAWSRSIREE